MVSTFLFIMGISAVIIAVAGLIGMIIKIVAAFQDYETGWTKAANILNLFAVIALGAGVSTLFFVVSQLV